MFVELNWGMYLIFWDNEEISEFEILNKNIILKILLIIISLRLYRVFDLF